MRSIRFCFPTLRQRAPVPCLFPAHRHPLFAGRAPGGMLPTETGERRASRRVERFGGSSANPGGLLGLPSFSTGPELSAIVPLASLSRSSWMPIRRVFRGARVPTPPGPPRLLPRARREASTFSPARGAFCRQGARGSSSALSSGDGVPCAPRFSSPRVPAYPSLVSQGRVSWAGPRGAIAPRRPVIGSSLPSAPLATRSFAAKGFARSARHQGRDVSGRFIIRRPSPRSPRPPPVLSSGSVRRKGFSRRAACRLLQTRPERTGTSASHAPRPPLDRAPLADRAIPWCLRHVRSPESPRTIAPCATRRPCHARSGSLRGLPEFPRAGRGGLTDRLPPSEGPAAFWAYCGRPSFEAAEHPSSPAPCHGGLENLRRASRGPSRQVSLAERGRVRLHGPVKSLVRAPSREGRRAPKSPGAFHRSSPRPRRVAPSFFGMASARFDLSVTPPALDGVGHCEREICAFFAAFPCASP